ncbi:MAG: HD domain-containing protein [Thermoanaerobaculia bacterium]
MNTDSARLLEAVLFAAEKHRQQRRKDEEASPYINHPIAVASLLASVGGITDIDVLCAAVLHDTIEDTETTAIELEEKFGSKVRGLVEEVSDDKSLPKAERKTLQIEHAAKGSSGAKLIKLGDKISNLHDIALSPPKDWSSQRRLDYLNWAELVIAGVRGTNAGLEARFDSMLASGRRALDLSAQD